MQHTDAAQAASADVAMMEQDSAAAAQQAAATQLQHQQQQQMPVAAAATEQDVYNYHLHQQQQLAALQEQHIPDPSQMQVGGQAVDVDHNEALIVLAGYQECMNKAINYLIEEEHMPEDDPFIIGLKQHLWERQQELNFRAILAQCNRNEDTSDMDLHDLSTSSRTADADHHQHHQCHLGGDGGDRLSELDNSTCSQCASNHHNNTSSASLDDSDLGNRLSRDLQCAADSVHPLTSSPRAGAGGGAEDELGASVNCLAMLVRNNPEIATVTSELLTLLEEEEMEREQQEADDNILHQDVSTADSGINESVG